MMSHWQGWLYVAAVLIPLGAFVVEVLGGRLLGRLNAIIATVAIGTSCGLSLVGLFWAWTATPMFAHHEAPGENKVEAAAAGHGGEHAAGNVHHEAPHAPYAWIGEWRWLALGSGTQREAEEVGRAARLVPRLPDLEVPLGIHIDGLAVLMFAMVTFIATLIHVYSMEYMRGDPRYPRFFTYLSLFCFSMLGLVASANVFMVFVFWELVGVCSYLLIGFWYEEKKNADAANKAFITNRIGDVGMLVGLGVLWTSLGTFNVADLNRSLSAPELRDDMGRLTNASSGGGLVAVRLPAGEAAEGRDTQSVGGQREVVRQMPYWLLVVAGLGIFAGCMGKSAQFPLHVWLPDAMAGPTPVSALIHAATMVAAGVYLVGRFFPLFAEPVLLYIAYTGGITLFIAATIAVVQTDYKKVLAYSTVSQLGFMMLGLGVGGWAAGLFHLITHAFFKALLFLGAGSVYHAVHTYEMPILGGLIRKMPITGYTMLVATLAIAGVPFFSGFYSKDAILANALFFVNHHPQHFLLFLLPAVGAMITAFYMFRMWFLVFAGEPRGRLAYAVAHAHGHDHGAAVDHSAVQAHEHEEHGHGDPYDHAHESPGLMTLPLLILAVPAFLIGWPITFGLPFFGYEPVLEGMLAASEPVRAVEIGSSKLWAMGASVLIAATGIGLGFLYYAPAGLRYFVRRRFSPAAAASRFGGVHDFLMHKWYFDEIYDALLVRPTLALARFVADFDRHVVDGLVNGAAWATRGLSRFEGFFDRFAVDGLVNLSAFAVYALGDWGRALQTGRLRSYLTMLALGVVALFVGVFYWIR